jgi:hypothetical protein
MIKIEITPDQAKVNTRSGVSKATGQPFTINEQEAYIYLGSRYPQRFTFNLDSGVPAYSAGIYELDASSLFVGDFSKLRIGKLVLKPFNEKEDGKR